MKRDLIIMVRGNGLILKLIDIVKFMLGLCVRDAR